VLVSVYRLTMLRISVSRRSVLATASTLCALVGCLLLASVPATATTTYTALSGHFGEPGSGDGQFSGPTGMAVSQSTGNVYVADTGNNRIEEFSSTGTYILQFDGSVGPPTGAFSSPESIAVDNSGSALDPSNGDVYVADSGNHVIDKFTSTGAYIGQLEEAGKTSFGNLTGVAVDPSGNVWVNHEGNLSEFTDTGSFVKKFFDNATYNGIAVDSSDVYIFGVSSTLNEFDLVTNAPVGNEGEPGTALAINPFTGNAFVDQGNRIVELPPVGGPTAPPVEIFATAGLSSSHGIALFVGAEGRFYASEREADQVEIFDATIVPTASGQPASAITETSATLGGAVDPEGLPVTSCRFEYGTTESYGQSAPCEQAPGGGLAPVAVSANIAGLSPNTTYHFRLAAGNAEFGEAAGADGTFVTPGPLTIAGESVSDVASTSATLDADVNPSHDSPTTYYFQYGTSAAYGTDVPTPPGARLRSDEGEIEVSQHLQGLQAGTVYHFRFVGISERRPGVIETVEGADRTFTTQSELSSGLPDGREWELVSPPDKHGALIEPLGSPNLGNGGVAQAAAAGGAITYVTNAPTEAQPQGYSNIVQVFSTRGSESWESRDIATPHEVATGGSVGHGQEYRFFSEDLSLAVLQPFGAFIPASSPHALAPGEASEQTPFLRTDFRDGSLDEPCESACYRPMVTGAPGHENVPSGTAFGEEGRCPPETHCGPVFVGASPDSRHVLLNSAVALTSAPAPKGGLYEWSADAPQADSLKLVGVLPNGEAAHEGILGDFGFAGENARGAVSRDGSRVFFSVSGSGGEGNHLYMRENAMQPQSPLGSKGECTVAADACTVQLDAVQSSGMEGGATPEFQFAAQDGSRVFFTDGQALTSDSAKQGYDLYECEIVEESGEPRCRLSDLTPIGSGEPAEVQGRVTAASEDGSWVYFVAHGTLGGVAGAVAGADNLYVLHDGASPSLVAVLSKADESDWGDLVSLTARVSPDGRWLAFMSQRELTGDDTHDATSGLPDAEVYLYDGEAKKLVCASCDPTGARPIAGEGKLANADGGYPNGSLAAVIPTWTPYTILRARYQSPYLSDGGRLFFNSNDALVPQDVNGTWDVYEYEPPGVPAGSRSQCTQQSATFSTHSGGCVGLISSGGSAEESAYLGASESGSEVFFLTTAKLAPSDFDASFDVYDAHECTDASPCFPAPVAQSPACTTADACRVAPAPQPSIFGSPASSTFSGAGNVTSSATGGGRGEPKSLTRARKLGRALRACRTKKRKQRSLCERKARKRYGPAKAGKVKVTKKGNR
jgi:hypothetical protein